MCDPLKGCICHRGFIGPNCDVLAKDAIVTAQEDTSSSGLTVLVVIMALLSATTALLVFLYYRKRVRNLKREIAHVHYTADPSSQPDQQHFDNPVYSYQSGGSRDDAATLLNNATHIHNNLGAGKLTNTDIEKRLRACASTDTYNPLSSLKNKDADSTNPNLYHCIDEDKLDHVYDEIKQKEGLEMEYDHLNYTPPANKWKTHYHRMNNGYSSQSPDPPPRENSPTLAPPIPPLPKLNTTPALVRHEDELHLREHGDSETP